MIALDPTLIGVIIGGAVGVIGPLLNSLITHYYASKREGEQWARQQNADRDKRRHDEKKSEREGRREIYHNSLTCLTSLMSVSEGDLTSEELRVRVEESLKWLNLLSLPYRIDENQKVKDFHSNLEDFIGNPLSCSYEMREAVIALAMTDNALFPNQPKEQPALPE